MSTRPETGSPDELVWLRGFEEARNQFLAENKRFREALNDIIGEALVYNGVPEFERITQLAQAALEETKNERTVY